MAAGHYSSGRWRLAADELLVFLNKHPDDKRAATVTFFLAEALLQVGQYEQAHGHFLEFLRREPLHRNARQALFRTGEAAYLSGNSAEARRSLAQFRGKYPDKSLQLSTMIIVGKRVSKANSEAKTIYSSMKRYYPDLEDKPKAVRLKETALFFFPIDTKFQGTKLIDPRLKKGLEAKIVKFIELRLVDRADQFNWTMR